MIIKNKLLIKDFFKRSDIISLSGFYIRCYIKPNADVILLEFIIQNIVTTHTQFSFHTSTTTIDVYHIPSINSFIFVRVIIGWYNMSDISISMYVV